MPDATNHVPNGSFEAGDAGWAISGTATKTWQAAGGLFGNGYLQVSSGAVNGGVTAGASGNAVQGATNVGSYYVRAHAPGDVGKVIAFIIDSGGGTYEQFKANVTLTADWQRVTRVATWANPSHTSWRILNRCESTAAATSWDIDGVQYEDGAVATDVIETNGTPLSRKDAAAALQGAGAFVAESDPQTDNAEAVLSATGAVAAAAGVTVDFDAQHDYLTARENAQAAEFRRTQQARETNRAALEAQLTGSAAAVARQEARWAALRRWEGWDPERIVKGDPA